jgi:hypothetical protein
MECLGKRTNQFAVRSSPFRGRRFLGEPNGMRDSCEKRNRNHLESDLFLLQIIAG